ncbi:DUF4373 domain-containing protein [Paenibacillus sp. NRS-1760]|uniref:DUF4373 domain-containing protein n=1 Tax=Paenibacillus sp. NRS-1760 TaxID=3233902 RepID=UPI003D295DAC
MARPVKEGLDYFPLDVDIHEDDKLVVVIGKFGMEGFGVVIRLLSEIYKNGYYYSWTEREQIVFSNRVNVNINSINDLVIECIKWGFFDHKCFDDYHILTSRGIQNRYIGASKRRKSITFIEAFTLIDLQEAANKVSYPINLVDSYNNRINVYINEVKGSNMLAENTQIEKEREKEKESKKKIVKISSRQSKSYAEDHPYFQMAIYFHEQLQSYVSSIGKAHLIQNSNFQKWADEFRKIIELDKRPKQEVGDVIRWVVADPFWQENILSPASLRKKYPELCLKMTGGKGKKSSGINKTAERNNRDAEKIREARERERVGNTDVVLSNG